MKDWAQLQISLYRSIKQEALSYLKRRPASFIRYEREFLKDQKKFTNSDHRELTRAINAADFVLLGDFHTLRQSQRLLLRLLRDPAVKPPKNIGLEILSSAHLSLLQSWLSSSSKASEEKLKAALQLESRWGSSFETYRELFIWCHKNKIRLLPLFSAEKNLHIRDGKFAKILAQQTEKTWALVGEFHCARSHLPAALKKQKSNSKILVLQQNDDKATLSRIKEFLQKKTLILKAPSAKSASADLFCILHTPLWIKYQSYLEQHLQNPDHDGFETLDAHDQITWSLKTLTDFLHDPRYPAKKSAEHILDFNVFGPEDPHFYKSIAHYSAKEESLVLSQIKASGVSVIADRRAIYLSELTVNSCAQAAGLYLYSYWSGTRIENRDFFKYSLSEAMAFLMSKILNHSRKPVTWKRWAQIAKTPARSKEAKAILSAQVFIEKSVLSGAWLKQMKPYQTQTATALGRNIAESAFESFLAGEFSRARLIRLMKTKIREESEAFEILVELKSLGRPFVVAERRW